MIAFSTSNYMLTRIVGPALASKAMHALFAGLVPPIDCPPNESVETLHRLDMLADDTIAIYLDSGAPHGKMRSRAFHWAVKQCEPEPHTWVTCDAQCTCDVTAMRALLREVHRPEPVCAVVPHSNRDARTVNVHGAKRKDGRVHIEWAGFGLVAMNRKAMQAVWNAHPGLAYIDGDGVERRALFLDLFTPGDGNVAKWWGEDASFWHRLPPSVERIAISEGQSVHAGFELDLYKWAEGLG